MQEKTTPRFNFRSFFWDIGLDIVIVLVLVFFIRTFLFSPFRVHGPSMCDNFNVYNGECYNGDGEFLITSRLSTWNLFGWSPTQIDRGDVVVFVAPYTEEKEFYIKRVIGVPGDTIKVEDGFVYLKEGEEFVQLEETYLNEENWGHTTPYRVDSQTFTVPDGEYFVLGDNRVKSSDARRCFRQLGCTGDSSPYISLDRIEGEVKLVIFPISHFRWVSGFDYSF
ncbi:MAG: signal peptidase I [Candidatus Gracilibacteria bacterium]